MRHIPIQLNIGESSRWVHSSVLFVLSLKRVHFRAKKPKDSATYKWKLSMSTFYGTFYFICTFYLSHYWKEHGREKVKPIDVSRLWTKTPLPSSRWTDSWIRLSGVAIDSLVIVIQDVLKKRLMWSLNGRWTFSHVPNSVSYAHLQWFGPWDVQRLKFV